MCCGKRDAELQKFMSQTQSKKPAFQEQSYIGPTIHIIFFINTCTYKEWKMPSLQHIQKDINEIEI